MNLVLSSFRLISDTLDRIEWCYYEYKTNKFIWSYHSGISIYYFFNTTGNDIEGSGQAIALDGSLWSISQRSTDMSLLRHFPSDLLSLEKPLRSI